MTADAVKLDKISEGGLGGDRSRGLTADPRGPTTVLGQESRKQLPGKKGVCQNLTASLNTRKKGVLRKRAGSKLFQKLLREWGWNLVRS